MSDTTIEKVAAGRERFLTCLLPLIVGPLAAVCAELHFRLRLGRFFGDAEITLLNVAGMALLGLVGGGAMSLLMLLEFASESKIRPTNTLLSVVLLILGILTCWIPFLGLVLMSIAYYRASLLKLPDWLSVLVVLCILFSIASCIAAGMIVYQDVSQ